MTKQPGITLSELLIALGIIALVAVFAIPKVLETLDKSTTNHLKAGREAAMIVTSAYNNLRANERPSASTTMEDLLPYMSYVKKVTDPIDATSCVAGTYACSSEFTCLLLHNGAVIRWRKSNYFDGTTPWHAHKLLIDPDGEPTGGSGDEGRSVTLYLFYTGRLKTRDQLEPNPDIPSDGATNNRFDDGPSSSCIPDWWSWDL